MVKVEVEMRENKMAKLVGKDKVDKAYAAYREKQKQNHVVEVSKVSKKYAKRLIEDGGLPHSELSFIDRLAAEKYQEEALRAQQEQAEQEQPDPTSQQGQQETPKNKQDAENDRNRRENTALLRKFKGMLAKALTDMKEFDLTNLTPLKISMILDTIPKIEKFLSDGGDQVIHHNHIQTSSLNLPPEAMGEIARIVLKHRVEQNDREHIIRRQKEANVLALKEGRPQDVIPVEIEAEFNEVNEKVTQ